MKQTSESHIVLYITHPESDELVLNVLKKHYAKLTICTNLKDLCLLLIDLKPKVLLMTGESLENSIYPYYRALEATKKREKCEHKIVSLIPRQCEEEAYQAYSANIIDDYLVARPVYELHRIVLICKHLLNELGVDINSDSLTLNKQLQKIESLKEPTKQSVKNRLTLIEQNKQALELKLVNIDNELDEAIKKAANKETIRLNISTIQQTLSLIRSDKMRLDLLRIQEKTITLLEQFILPNSTETTDENKNDDNNTGANEYQFNRLYQQDLDPEELIKQAGNIPQILLIEDDIISMQLTKMLLNNYNVNIETVNNGRQAIAILEEKKFNFVLLDINLPDTNGIYIVDQITNKKGMNMDTPFVILSGNKNKSIVSKAIERGATGYLLKPLHKPTADKLIKKFIK
ncbi:response regulator [Paraglaciecola sp. L3A3]|uniref:response regulator n=1 Tax=Paraglaciecola sp. L3A3 TaxID=2686358 RepID=UPI00131D2DB2|nr:response regulator [Paraglaciecola sp. L3A3]